VGKSIRSESEENIARLGRQRWTVKDAAHVLSAWEASGLSLAAFSRRHALTAQRVAWWRDRFGELSKALPALKSAPAPLRFVPAVVRASAAGSGSAVVTIRVCGGVAVEIADPALVPAQWLAALLRQCGEQAR